MVLCQHCLKPVEDRSAVLFRGGNSIGTLFVCPLCVKIVKSMSGFIGDPKNALKVIEES